VVELGAKHTNPIWDNIKPGMETSSKDDFYLYANYDWLLPQQSVQHRAIPLRTRMSGRISPSYTFFEWEVRMLCRFSEGCNRLGGQSLLLFAGDGRLAVVLLRAVVAEARVVAAGNDAFRIKHHRQAARSVLCPKAEGRYDKTSSKSLLQLFPVWSVFMTTTLSFCARFNTACIVYSGTHYAVFLRAILTASKCGQAAPALTGQST